MLKLWRLVISNNLNAFNVIEPLHKFIDASCLTYDPKYSILLTKTYKNLSRLLRQYVQKLHLPKELLAYVLSFAIQFIISWSKIDYGEGKEAHYIDLIFEETIKIIKLILEHPKCCAYSSLLPETTTEIIEANREFLIKNVFTSENTKGLMLALMQKYLSITRQEISSWNENAEEFAIESMSISNPLTFTREAAAYIIGIVYKFLPSKVEGLFDEIDKFLSLPLSPSTSINDFITVLLLNKYREKVYTTL